MMATAVRFFTLPYRPRNPSFVLNNTLPSSSFGSLTISSHNLFSTGCLSISIMLRPIRQSVVCMSSRYGAGSRKRKLKSRKRGGDPDKKRKRTRSSLGKRKQKFRIVKLASEAGTGYVYVRKVGKNATKSFQNKKNDPSTKLELMKYDPKAKRHVLFKERK